MEILRIFNDFDKNIYRLLRIYSEICDNYRGSNDFDIGVSKYIETVEGKKLEKELLEMIKSVNLNIDEIIIKINEIEFIENNDLEKINNLIINTTNDLVLIIWKNKWIQEKNTIDKDEKIKLNKYYELFYFKIKILNKQLIEKRDNFKIMTINDAQDILNEINRNNPIIKPAYMLHSSKVICHNIKDERISNDI
jgi:hypothetical protein